MLRIFMQKEVLDFIENYLKNLGIEHKYICKSLRIIHTIIPLVAALFIFFGPKYLFYITVFINIFIFVLFILCNGCILSRLERRFCEDDYTVMDPVLIFFEIPTTDENRVYYSIASHFTFFLGTYIIYNFRFKYKNNI